MPNKQPWSKNLKMIRVKQDMTQRQAAEKIGVPLSTYGRWERGYNYPMEIYREKIAHSLEVPAYEIFTTE